MTSKTDKADAPTVKRVGWKLAKVDAVRLVTLREKADLTWQDLLTEAVNEWLEKRGHKPVKAVTK